MRPERQLEAGLVTEIISGLPGELCRYCGRFAATCVRYCRNCAIC